MHIVAALLRKRAHVASFAALVAAAVASLFGDAAWAVGDAPGGPKVNQLNLPVGVTKIASDIYDLHTFVLLVCLVIFVLVFGVMFYAVFKHRKSVGHKAETWHENTTVEIIWTIVPFIIVIAMALPATRLIVDMKDTTNADLTIKATGYQWRWGYDYLNGEGEGIGFISTLTTPREESGFPSEGIKAHPARRHVPARRRQSARRAGQQEGARHHDRQRRDPRVRRAAVRHQAGRDSRLRARHVVQGREDRHVPRAVPGAVRRRACVHADQRQGRVRRGLHEVGRTTRRRRWRPRPTIRPRRTRSPS